MASSETQPSKAAIYAFCFRKKKRNETKKRTRSEEARGEKACGSKLLAPDQHQHQTDTRLTLGTRRFGIRPANLFAFCFLRVGTRTRASNFEIRLEGDSRTAKQLSARGPTICLNLRLVRRLRTFGLWLYSYLHVRVRPYRYIYIIAGREPS